MKKMMPITFKKLIQAFLIFSMLSTMAFAGPPTPMPVVFEFYYDGSPVSNFKIDLEVGVDSITRYTNDLGKIQVDVGTGSPDFPNAEITDVLELDCGVAPCKKSYKILNIDTPYVERFDLESAPCTCPPCKSTDCGDGGGNGGTVTVCTQEECDLDFPCKKCKECPEIADCPKPTVEECENIISHTSCDCPDTAGGNELLVGLLSALLGLVGGAGIFFKLFNNKILTGARTGIKTYRGNDGTIKIHHKHPGTNGYHDPNIVHRKPEDHSKGMIDVADRYYKDSAGKWVYRKD